MEAARFTIWYVLSGLNMRQAALRPLTL